MKTKEKYLEQAEIKVKNLLSDLYESESEIQKEKRKTKERLSHKITALTNEYSEMHKKRKELQDRFEQLKSVGDVHWKKARDEFDLLLKYVEGDKETFIQKAEIVINDLGNKIREMEDKAVNAASDVKNELTQKANELKISKKELQEKINNVKTDTSERWRDIKHWFIEKSKSLKEYITSV